MGPHRTAGELSAPSRLASPRQWMRCPVILGVSALAIVLVVPAFAVPLPPSALPLDYSSLYSPDWPMYGHDLWGTHFNSVETAVNESTVGSLVEKWRVGGSGVCGTPPGSPGAAYLPTPAGGRRAPPRGCGGAEGGAPPGPHKRRGPTG